MSIWKTILKRSVLALTAAVVAVSWTQTGRAQSPCQILRGQDPLDVLNSGVRHNVWIVLDFSGSMDSNVPGTSQTKMEVARDTLVEVIDEFKDASGRPLVNWGYVRYGANSVNNTSACSAQFTNNCTGLLLSELINPPSCSDPTNVAAVRAKIAGIGNKDGTGSTPNGISMDQISNEIVSRGYVAGLLPNQKNFVILVTDGDDTCECGLRNSNQAGKLVNGVWTPTPLPPFASSDTIPRSLRGGSADSSYTVPVGTASADEPNIRAINAGTKGRLFYERLNPTAADRATGAKGGGFVIGLGLSGFSPSRAHHMAWEASGAFYGNPNEGPALLANNKAQLKQALRDAFAKIGVPPTSVTLGPATIGTVREVIPTFTNPFVTADMHVGDVGPVGVDTDDIQEARKVRGDHERNVAFYSSVDVPGFKGHFTAYNLYKVTDAAKPRDSRLPVLQDKIWDAGERLQLMSPDSRNILFNKKGSTTLLPFTSANVSASDLGVSAGYLGALTDNDARDMVIGVIRGYRLFVHPSTGTLYRPDGKLNFDTLDASGNPTWKLYDAIAAPAIVQSPPRSPDFDPPQNHGTKYGVGGNKAGDGFYWDHFNRKTMVYLPTNGGMMHAFDAETGDEVFAYIPDDVLGMASGEILGSRDTLRDFVELVVNQNNGIQNHQYLIAGSPTVRDAFLRADRGGDDQWHTLLAFGRGRAGRFVSVLDITDPLAPMLRFNVGNREGVNDGLLDGLGETWSTPVMGNVLTDPSLTNPDRVDQWLAFFGAGYGCNNSNKEGQYLFAVRVEDGFVHYRGQVTNNASAMINYNALVSMPVLFNPHQEDVADQKDYTTRAYIGDLQGVIWKLVTTDVNPNNWTLVKFAEMGLDQPIVARVSLMRDVSKDEVHVLAGSGGDSRASGTFKFVSFIDTDAEGANTAQYPLGSAPNWVKLLNPEERVYVAPVTFGKIGDPAEPASVVFAASKPTFDPAICEGTFFSTLYGLTVESGVAAVDLTGDGSADESLDLGETKIAGLTSSGEVLFISESGGLGQSGALVYYSDGADAFNDPMPSGASWTSIQVLVDSFRISPF